MPVSSGPGDIVTVTVLSLAVTSEVGNVLDVGLYSYETLAGPYVASSEHSIDYEASLLIVTGTSKLSGLPARIAIEV